MKINRTSFLSKAMSRFRTSITECNSHSSRKLKKSLLLQREPRKSDSGVDNVFCLNLLRKYMNSTKLGLGLLAIGAMNSGAATVWNLGTSAVGRSTPETASLYGAPHSVTFVQEAPNSPLPGDPNSPASARNADDDYYFAGVYSNQVDGGETYTPLGIVGSSEIAVERAFTNGATDLRYHFNFDGGTLPTDVFTFSFMMMDLNDNGTGTGAYDIALSVNGVSIDSFTHNASTNNVPFVGKSFTLGDVGGTAGAADDNYVQLSVTNPAVTTARWSNVDYVQLDVTSAVPEPSSSGLALLSIAGLGFIRRRK
jgi:hypothetical protein